MGIVLKFRFGLSWFGWGGLGFCISNKLLAATVAAGGSWTTLSSKDLRQRVPKGDQRTGEVLAIPFSLGHKYKYGFRGSGLLGLSEYSLMNLHF